MSLIDFLHLVTAVLSVKPTKQHMIYPQSLLLHRIIKMHTFKTRKVLTSKVFEKITQKSLFEYQNKNDLV